MDAGFGLLEEHERKKEEKEDSELYKEDRLIQDKKYIIELKELTKQEYKRSVNNNMYCKDKKVTKKYNIEDPFSWHSWL